MESNVSEHSKIQSNYAAFVVKDTSNALKPHRPPTQPTSDIEKERKSVLSMAAMNLHVIQLALLTIFLTLLEYLLLPAEYAHPLGFMTLCVGAAVGIYLAKL